MKKRILSIVLAICLVLSCVPITVFAANADATELQNKLNSGGTVTLSKDYTIDTALNVKNTVILDLNGHVIKMTGSGSVIKVAWGNLTLQDTNKTATHTDTSLPAGGVITGGNAYEGGGVYIGINGSMTMTGGTIENCSAEYGGGVAAESGSFTMTGGNITNCNATTSDYTYGGGGVYNISSFTMSGGTIANCNSTTSGGGVFSYGDFSMSDTAIIRGCSARSAGGVRAYSGTFTMNGGTIETCISTNGTSDAVTINSNASLLANGGIVKGTVIFDSYSTITTTSTDSYTKFYNEVTNYGTISSGVYYGGIQNESPGTVSGTYHTVSFNSNGGSTVPTQWFVNTKTATALNIKPIREGYEFRGWYNGNTSYDFTKPVTGNITLTAKWASSSVSTEAELRQAINDGASKIKLIGDFQLTSILDLTDKVITLDLNGHVLSPKNVFEGGINLNVSKSPIYGSAILTLIDSNPTATHNDSSLPLGGVLACSIGLNAENGSTQNSFLNADGGTVTGIVGLNHDGAYIRHTSGNTTPTAFTGHVSGSGGVLNGIYYGYLQDSLIKGKTVTFKNGDDIYAKEVVYNNAAVAPVDPEKEGYAFAGWYNGSTKYDFPQTITSDITLTAKWINKVNSEATLRTAIDAGVNPIKLMADINLSSALDLSQKNVTIDLNGHVISGADISINTGNGKASLTLIDSNPTATHTDNTLPKGGVVTSKISMKQSGGGYNDCVLYANGGTVTSEFNTNTNAVAIKCTSDTPTAFTGKISGYTHLYGGIYYGTIASTVTIEAKKITFKNGNDTYAYEIIDSGNNTVAPISPSVKEGYNGFDGWYNGDTKYTFGSTISESITLTAKFSNPKTYNISYNLNGGTATNPGTYTVESDAITLNNPVKTGYTFTGWSGTGLTGENNMTVTIPKESTGNRSYTAHFSQSSYTVKFDTVGGSGISDKTGVKWDDTVLSGITNPTKVGCEFTGWKCGDMTVNAFTKYSDLVADDTVKSVTLVAQWKDTEKPVITGLEKGKTYCGAVEFEVSDNDGVASVKAGSTTLAPGTNGKYTLAKGIGTVTVVATDNTGNTTKVTVTVNNGHTAGTDDGNCSTPVYCIYHPNTVVVKAKSHDFSGEWNKDENGHWHVCQNDGCTVPETKASHSGTDDGDCTTAVICECGYIITAAQSEHTFGAWQSNGNNTHTRCCTITGCKGSETKDCTGGQATYFKKAVCKDCNKPYGSLLTDLTAPTGEITIGTNKWNSFLNTITFGLFFKNTQSVTVTATDDSYTHAGYTDDKAVKVEYLLSDKELSKTDLAGKEFTEYGSAFNINPDNKYVVYVKLTDHPGNVTYISSNGVVLDATSPVISDIENGKTYCEAQTVTVTEKYIKSVTVNGTEVPLDANNQFTLNPKNGTQTVVVTDKAGNETAVTVTVNNGHTAGNDDGDCSTPVYCIYHPNTVVVKAKSHDFSGEWNKDKDGHWHTCQNVGCNVAEPKASHSGTDDGDCTTAVICECGYIITAAKSQHSYGAWQSKGNNTHTRYCTVTGCKGSETKNCSGGTATYFKKAVCKDCNKPYGKLLTDSTAPTGEITVGKNKWNSFLNTITFGIFFKNTQSVTITASDDSYSHDGYTDDKAVKIEYYLHSSETALTKTDLAGKEFTEYGSAFNINPDNKYVVYVKLTDHAGNVTYISSNGVVLDATAPAITGVTDGAVYYTTQKAVVTDDNLKSVTLNGVIVSGTTVTLDGNTDEVYTIVATDKSGNSKTVTVTMKPISSLAQSIDDINGENVNSSNKEAIEAVKESVGEVDISNATDSEKEALNDINGRCDELLDIIDKAQKATETENIKNVEGINPDNVTKDDREALEKAKADLEKALEEYGSNYTDDEKAKIQSDLERVNKSLKVLDDVKAVEDSIASLPDTFKPDDLDTVQKIQDAKKSYDALTDYEKSLVSKDTKAKLDTLTKGITAYAFYEGSGGIWTIGQEGTLTFTANGAYSKFTGIKVDGKDVEHSNYTAKSGSTIISLNAGYLNTLSVGTHTLTVLYTDGEAEMDFEVKAIKKDTEETTMPKEPVSTEEITVPKESTDATKTTKLNKNTSKKSPETGNDSETALLLAFLLSCGGAIIVTGAYGKRKKHI